MTSYGATPVASASSSAATVIGTSFLLAILAGLPETHLVESLVVMDQERETDIGNLLKMKVVSEDGPGSL